MVYAPDAIRIRIARGKFGRDFSYAITAAPEGKFRTVSEDAAAIRCETDSLKIVVQKKPVRLSIYDRRNRLLSGDDPELGTAWQGNDVTGFKSLFPSERFIGLGEKTGPLDRRGNSYVNWNTDHYAYSPKDDPLYASIPFYIGLHDSVMYGIFLDDTRRTTFNFGASTDNRVSWFSSPGGELNYYFLGGSSVPRVIEEYTRLTGRMQVPPLWSLGYQQCRWSYYPESEVLNLAETFRQKRIPADVIYLDIHYMDAYKVFTWHPERFPTPRAMAESLRQMGFHLVTIVDPGIKVEKGYFASDEGSAGRSFLTYPGGANYVGEVWPGRCNFPDFTSPAVRLWWGKSLSHLVDSGVTGFWNDMNEPATWGQSIPDLVQADFDGAPATMKEAHNVYGLEMARSTFEGSKSLLSGNRPFVLTRAAYAGIQRYSAVWTGDNVPSDEHMLLAVRLVNSMGISGIPFTGPDIGGFSGDATPRLFERWLSIGTYTPFFRNHKQYGMKRQEPWSFGEDVEQVARRAIEQRYRLLPYIYSTFHQAAQTGMPVARSLAIFYPFDDRIYWQDFENEYLFGDNILVAPVVSTENFCKVYLPAGDWYRISTGVMYHGGQTVLAEAPIDDLPVFARAGGIIPMQRVVQYASEIADTMYLHIFFGDRSSIYHYYEDDGLTYNYDRGDFCARQMVYDPAGRQFTLTKAEGSRPSKFKWIALVIHGSDGVSRVTVDGTSRTLAPMAGPPAGIGTVFGNSDRELVIKW